MSPRSAADQLLRDLALLRQVRDRIDRDHAQPLDVPGFTEVCFAVGFSSLGTFSTRFSDLVGVPPSIYRRDAKRLPTALRGQAGHQTDQK